MKVVFRPEARRELIEAQRWYEQRSPGLGFEFARSVDVAITMALRTPLAFARVEADFRQVITRRFPYAIIYFPTDTQLVIVSCFHQRRRPGAWSANRP